MRTRYTIREPGVPYFITCTVVQWIPLFTRKPYFDILIDTLQLCMVRTLHFYQPLVCACMKARTGR